MGSQQELPPVAGRNIVQIIADDLGLMLGCYGTQNIHTPNIDRLAAEGTRFTHAFASTASCSGSRSTIYTGLHTHQNGQYGLAHGHNHFQTHDHIETLPDIFNSLGYLTGIIAKVHVGPHSAYPWEWYSPSDSRDVAANATVAGRFFDHARDTNRPFHLTIGYRDPHRDTTRGGFGNNDLDIAHLPISTHYKPKDVEIPDFLSDVPELRAELVEYYKSITRMDHGIGLVMQELQQRGLDRNTLVIFMSDNGAPFVNSKTTLYDAGIRLPLIVRRPAADSTLSGGIVNPNMISFLDILPTCIDWATTTTPTTTINTGKITSPPRLGHSFLPILDSTTELPATIWPQQHVFGSHTFHEIQNYWPTRYMRTRRYKYHRNIAWKLDFPFGSDLYGSLSWEGLRNQHHHQQQQEEQHQTNGGSQEMELETDTPEVLLGRRRLTSYIHRGPEELFDLLADPHEVCNLVSSADPEHIAILAEMRDAVEGWQYLTNDVWLMRDGASAISTSRYQAQGLKLRNRFDFEARDPRSVEGVRRAGADGGAGVEGENGCWRPPAVDRQSGGAEAEMGKMG